MDLLKKGAIVELTSWLCLGPPFRMKILKDKMGVS